MQHILKQSFKENLNFGPMKKPPMDHVLLDDLPDSICKLQSNASCTSFRRLQKDLHMVAKILTGREHLHSQAGSSKAALIRTRDIPHWEYSFSQGHLSQMHEGTEAATKKGPIVGVLPVHLGVMWM